MLTLRDHILSCIIYTISLIISILTAVFGILALVHNNNDSNISSTTSTRQTQVSMTVLIAVELFYVFSIPFYFLNLWIKTLISSVSLFASIGAGLRLIDSLIFTNYNTEETAQLLRGSYTMEVFFLCFVASFGIKALAIGFDLQFMNVDYLQNGSASGAAAAGDGESLIDSLNGDGINLQNFRDHSVRFKTTRQYDDSEDQRYVSLKHSNATLVDQHNPINLNIKPSMTSVGPLSNITISTPQILANSTFSMQRLPIIAQPIQQGLPSSGSMSSLRTNSDHQHQRDSVRSVNNTILGTPTLDKFMKKKTTNEDRKYGIERAAINRIPSELLPPHLKTVVSATNQSNQGLAMHSYSHSNIVSQYQQTSPIHSSAPSGNDNSNMMIMSDIPRAQSSFQLGSNGGANVNVDHAALRKLATQDWLRQPAPFKSSTATGPCSFFSSAAPSVSPSPNDQPHFMNNEHSTAYPQESTLPPFTQPVFNFTGTATATDIPIKDDLTFSSEEDSDASALSINSADNDKAASRYLASARNSISGQGAEKRLSSADFLEDAIKDHGTSQLKSTDTDINGTTGFSKARSHSPHKSLSFFKSSHSRQGSMNSSFTFGRTTSMSYSASAPGSPKRRGANASPSKKLSIKNLSLSNISFDVNNIATSAGGAQHPDNTEDDSHIPNLAYLHELQKSPSPTKHHHHLSQSSTNTVIINSRRKSIHGKHPSMSKINESLLQSKKESVINTAATATTTTTTTTANASSNKSKDQSPNSKRSSNGSMLSNGSLFPEEVIGEYDREKWRALQRLNMVENEN